MIRHYCDIADTGHYFVANVLMPSRCPFLILSPPPSLPRRQPGDPVDHVRAQRMADRDPRVLEMPVRCHTEPAHHRLGRLVEHGRHGPDLGESHPAEGHVKRGARSDSRQRRISNRSVRMLSKLAVTRGSVAARTSASPRVPPLGRGHCCSAACAAAPLDGDTWLHIIYL